MNNGVQDTLAPLPQALALRVFFLLPVDARMRAREVSPCWRATLNEVSLWTSLDVSATAGLARPARDILLRAAAARAGGHLHTLDVSDCPFLTTETLMAVVGANSGTLTDLRVCGNFHGTRTFDFERAVPLLRAAPQLRIFDADMHCGSFADAHPMLSNEGLFVPMRVRKLSLSTAHDETLDDAAGLALAGRLTGHTSLAGLSFSNNAPHISNAALAAVLDVALVLRFTDLSFSNCRLFPASAPALARLLGGGTLTKLWLWEHDGVLLDAAAAALLGDALRANSSLTRLSMSSNVLRNPAVATTLLGALTGHRSLRWLQTRHNDFTSAANRAAVGAALGLLIAANAPALEVLDVKCCSLGDVGLRPLMDAPLQQNTHLRVLDCRLRLYGLEVYDPDNALQQRLSAARASGTLLVLQ
jgi:hypothetical protein